MKMKNTIKITESKFNQIISECVIKELNEGHGWETFKDSVKAGWNADGSSDNSGKDFSMGDVVKGKPNKAKSQYHSLMSKTAEDPASRKKHAHQATFTEPGLSGKIKRGASVAGAMGGAVAKSAVNGAKQGVKKGVDAMIDGAWALKHDIRRRKNNKQMHRNYVNKRMEDIEAGNGPSVWTMNDEYEDKVNKEAQKKLAKKNRGKIVSVDTNNPNYDKAGYDSWKSK